MFAQRSDILDYSRIVNSQCDSSQVASGHSGIMPVVTVHGGLEVYTLIWVQSCNPLPGSLEVFFMFHLLHHLIGLNLYFYTLIRVSLFFKPSSFLPSVFLSFIILLLILVVTRHNSSNFNDIIFNVPFTIFKKSFVRYVKSVSKFFKS